MESDDEKHGIRLAAIPLVYVIGPTADFFGDDSFKWQHFTSVNVLKNKDLAKPDAIVLKDIADLRHIPVFAHWQIYTDLNLKSYDDQLALYERLIGRVRNTKIVFVSDSEELAKDFYIPSVELVMLSTKDFLQSISTKQWQDCYYFLKDSDRENPELQPFYDKIPFFLNYASYFNDHFHIVNCEEWSKTSIFQCFQIVMRNFPVFTSPENTLTLRNVEIPFPFQQKVFQKHNEETLHMQKALLNEVQKIASSTQVLAEKMVC